MAFIVLSVPLICSHIVLQFFYTECRYDEFQCPGGYCIPDFQLCDGYDDCVDGSDEYIKNCISEDISPVIL